MLKHYNFINIFNECIIIYYSMKDPQFGNFIHRNGAHDLFSNHRCSKARWKLDLLIQYSLFLISVRNDFKNLYLVTILSDMKHRLLRITFNCIHISLFEIVNPFNWAFAVTTASLSYTICNGASLMRHSYRRGGTRFWRSCCTYTHESLCSWFSLVVVVNLRDLTHYVVTA